MQNSEQFIFQKQELEIKHWQQHSKFMTEQYMNALTDARKLLLWNKLSLVINMILFFMFVIAMAQVSK